MSEGSAPNDTRGLLAASLQTVISIASFFVVKHALAFVTPAPFLLFRTVGAAALLGLVLAITGNRERSTPAKGDLWRLAGLGVIGVPVNQGLFVLGLSLTSPAHAALIYALTPTVVLLVGVARGKERLWGVRLGGVAVAFAGVALVLGGPAYFSPASRDVEETLRGDLLILAGTVAWGLYTALARGVIARVGAIRATTGALSFGALAYLPLGLWLTAGVELQGVPTDVWLAVAWMVVMGSTVSYLSWYYAIKRLDPTRVAIFVNLQPIGTVLVTWAVMGKPLTWTLLAGGVLVVAGVLMTQRAPAR